MTKLKYMENNKTTNQSESRRMKRLLTRGKIALDMDNLRGDKYLDDCPSNGIMVMMCNGERIECPHGFCNCGKVQLHGEYILNEIHDWVECHIASHEIMRIASISKSGHVYFVNLVPILIC